MMKPISRNHGSIKHRNEDTGKKCMATYKKNKENYIISDYHHGRYFVFNKTISKFLRTQQIKNIIKKSGNTKEEVN